MVNKDVYKAVTATSAFDVFSKTNLNFKKVTVDKAIFKSLAFYRLHVFPFIGIKLRGDGVACASQ